MGRLDSRAAIVVGAGQTPGDGAGHVADAALLLAPDEAASVIGVVLPLDGGQSAGVG